MDRLPNKDSIETKRSNIFLTTQQPTETISSIFSIQYITMKENNVRIIQLNCILYVLVEHYISTLLRIKLGFPYS